MVDAFTPSAEQGGGGLSRGGCRDAAGYGHQRRQGGAMDSRPTGLMPAEMAGCGYEVEGVAPAPFRCAPGDLGRAVRRCESFTPIGASVLLMKSLPWEQRRDEPGREAAAVLGHALPLMEPLAVDIEVCPRLADEPLLDEGGPGGGSWHVRRADLTAARGVRPAWQLIGSHQERRVSAIDTASVERVIAEAIDRPAPPGGSLVFRLLEATHARVRLLDDELPAAATMSVWRVGKWEFPVPIVRDERGCWIDDYPDDLDPPLELRIDNVDGAVRAGLRIGWSLWRDEGSPEHTAVVEFARAVIADGYRVEQVGLEFRDWLPPARITSIGG